MKKLFIMAAVLTIGSHAFCYNAREIVGEKNYEILQKEGFLGIVKKQSCSYGKLFYEKKN